MTIQTSNYTPEKGILVLSEGGYQQVTSRSNGDFLFKSRKKTDFVITNRFQVDSAWETGNIFRIEGNNVKKTSFDGTLIKEHIFTNPECVSVSQQRLTIPHSANDFSEEYGCWVIDSVDGKLTLLDSDFNVLGETTGFTNPVRVISSDFDHGCFVFDDMLGMVYKLNSSCEIIGFLSYFSISTSLFSAREIKSLFVSGDGSLWLLLENTITKLNYSNGSFSEKTIINPLSDLGLSANESVVNDMDIDRISSNVVYAIGGCSGEGWIAKYSHNGLLLNDVLDINISCPSIIRCSQVSGSTSLYIVTESDYQYLPAVCGPSSSSTSLEYSSLSSSSSSSKDSSSSSSSSSSSKDSSSSSSSEGISESSSSSSLDSSSSSSSSIGYSSESSSSSSSVEYSSSSSSIEYSSSSSSSSSLDSSSSSESLCVCDGYTCANLTGSLCPAFSDWQISGSLKSQSVDGNCSLYVRSIQGNDQYFNLTIRSINDVALCGYDNSYTGLIRLFAGVPQSIILPEINGSGVTGTVYYNGGTRSPYNVVWWSRLSCVNISSSSSSSS